MRAVITTYRVKFYDVVLCLVIKIKSSSNEERTNYRLRWFYLQVDHKKGFGGKFGVETDKVDKSAKGWSEHYKPELHPSQTDHKKGFGGKFGVEDDRRDEVTTLSFEIKDAAVRWHLD